MDKLSRVAPSAINFTLQNQSVIGLPVASAYCERIQFIYFIPTHISNKDIHRSVSKYTESTLRLALRWLEA